MRVVGYEFLRSRLGISSFEIARPAKVMPVNRVIRNEDHLAIPVSVAPTTDGELEHLLFALKHEGTNLHVIAETVKRIPKVQIEQALAKAPNGQYIRCACYLWETYTGATLDCNTAISGAVVDVFDPTLYVTGPRVRNARWRVAFNGIGTPTFCVTVRRTPAIVQFIESDILGRVKAFAASLDPVMMDRALAWAYLHETKDSFAIEREVPTEDKARTFVKLLQHAHDDRDLSEEYLVELQSSTISNPYDKAVQFRTEQNHLANGLPGAAGVSYVPPPPSIIDRLMTEWMDVANALPRQIDPLVAASVLSFGFVYLHPFMDGNGRLSRFVIHKALCASGALDKGLLLPVSAAMKRNEAAYLSALQKFSKPARELVNVTWAGEGLFSFDFKTDEKIWRFWDATDQVEFGLSMAEQALNIDLLKETKYLALHDCVMKAVNERFDVRTADLATLVTICLSAGGTLSKNKRKRYFDRVGDVALDFIEVCSKEALREDCDGMVDPDHEKTQYPRP